MNPLVAQTLTQSRNIRDLYRDAYANVLSIRKEVKAATCSQEDMVDIAFILRETSKMVDDLRKEFVAAQTMCEKTVCLLWTVMNLNDPTGPSIIKGEVASASPDLKQMATLPRHGSPEFTKLCDYLGVAQSAHEFVRIHWPTITKHITELAQEGRPLPPGINPDKVYPLYRLHPLRKRRGVELEELNCEITEHDVGRDRHNPRDDSRSCRLHIRRQPRYYGGHRWYRRGDRPVALRRRCCRRQHLIKGRKQVTRDTMFN